MKVYIAVDSSQVAEDACDWYLKNLHRDGNEVIIGHHAEQPKLPTLTFEGHGAFPAEQISNIMIEHNKKLAKLENHFTMKVKDHKGIKVAVHTCEDKPGHAICHAAKEFHADMIVIGSRGHGMIKRKILGSVSDYVLHHAHTHVCICPAGAPN